jgi:type II secretory pathway component GspD/PulD (secretin)
MKFTKLKKTILPVILIALTLVFLQEISGLAVENSQPEKLTPATVKGNINSAKPINNLNALSLSREFKAFPESSKIDLILRDIDVASVLRIIAKEGNKNIVLDDSVQGFINADLKKVSLNEAMKIILTSQELEYRTEGNTIFVASRPAMAKKGLNRKFIKAFKLNNSNAVDVAKILEASIFNKGYIVTENSASSGTAMQAVANQTGTSATGQGAQTPAGSSVGQSSLIDSKTIRGKVETLDPGSSFNDASKLASQIKIQNRIPTVQDIEVNNNDGGAIVIPDMRTNSILIAGLQEDILIAQEIIKQLDKALPQVSIDVSLIELTKTKDNDLGLLFGGQSNYYTGGFNSLTGSSTANAGMTTLANQAGFMYSTVTDYTNELSVKLNALIKTNKAKILANPTVLALDGSESLVKITDQIISRMVTTVEAQTNTITYTPELSDIGIVLNILPKVGDDGFVTLRVRPSITTFLSEQTLGTNGYANLISTREVILQDARIKSGETLAIAGLLKETDIENISKIPFAGDLPVFGKLFRNKTQDHVKSEIVILITPKIVDDIAYN